MSAGFFGSYFRRKKEDRSGQSASPGAAGADGTSHDRDGEEAQPLRGNLTPVRGVQGSISGSSVDSEAARNYLRYGLRGIPPEKTATSGAYQEESAGYGTPGSREETPITPAHESDKQANITGDADPDASHPGLGPSVSTPPEAANEEGSPLDELMQDRVVMALLQEGVITMPQALTALSKKTDEQPAALWRIVAELPGVDRDAVYAEAARAAGFTTAYFSEKKPTDELIKAVCGLFAPPSDVKMLRLGILPYEFNVDPAAKRHTLVFACHDPSNPDVLQFVQALGQHVELRYAPASMVHERIKRVRQQLASTQLQADQEEGRTRRASSRAGNADNGGHEREERAARLGELSKHARQVEEKTAESEHTAGGGEVPPHTPVISSGFSLGDLARILQTDTAISENVRVENRIEPAQPEIFSGDGLADPPSSGLFDGTGDNDLSDGIEGSSSTPKLQRTGWTGNPDPDDKEPDDEQKSADTKVQKEGLEGARKDRVVAMLLRKELVTEEQVYTALQKLKKDGSREVLWRVLASLPDVERDAIYAEAARMYAFPAAVFQEGQPDPEFARSVIDTFSEERKKELFKLRILPFECDVEQATGAIKLVFITHDPTRPEVHRLMQQLKLERFELRYAPESMVTAALLEAFPRKNEFLDRLSESAGAYDLGMSYDDSDRKLIDEEALEAEISRSTLINLFEATLVEAVRQGASDIHIYPNAEKKVEIHFRVDGRLHLWHTEEKVHPEALLAVIKDNSTNVDRFERDAAQDGFIQRWIDDVLIRFRVSVLPIANASQEIRSESIVIRVLDDRKVITDLRKLGLLDLALERFDQAIRQPHGMVILTGPTGSGKSTTLVAALHQVVTPEVNTLTVEDPVEYIIPGVRQIKLNHKLGLEEALRSILRHDPDVVMVGEMRDRQTAELAIKLANTGHLTFSTLHTNDAPSAISRLYKMGIEPFLIAYAINLVVAQRLIRTLCPACKTVDDDPDPVMLKKLGFTDEEIATTTIYKPGDQPNCKVCKGLGYKGRRAVSEALYFSRAIRHMIVEADKAIDEEGIRDQAIKEGMLTLRDSAREIVKMGETSIMEMIRVVTTEF